MVSSVGPGVGAGQQDGFRAVDVVLFDNDGGRDAVSESTQHDSFHRRFGGVEAPLSGFGVERKACEVAEAS